MVILLHYNHRFFWITIINENLDVAEKNQERQTQASEHYRHSLGEIASDKSFPQQTGVKELSFISRSPVQWQGDRSGLQNNSVFGFEKSFCRNRYRASFQSKGNLSLNSAFSWPAEDSQLHTSDVMFSIINKGLWLPLQQKNGVHFQLDHPGAQVVRAEALWGSLSYEALWMFSTIFPTRMAEPLWH